MPETAVAPEKIEFKAELKQLLHLITHSLYSNREIFLRELISNASDAINKLRYNALENEARLENDKDFKIKIIPNPDAGTLTISDNGIGMSREDIIENLGTIARSGTRAFLETLKAQATQLAAQPELIGQFGVGFYSAFMVADRITVYSRRAGDPPSAGVRWESDGQGEYTVEPYDKPGRGTDVVLHLKQDAREFAQEYRLKSLVKKFSDFIEHPVVMDCQREEGEGENKRTVTVEETLNARKAIWLRPKSEVTAEEYRSFYQQLTHTSGEPAAIIHYTAEGVNEFKVLLFILSERPFMWQFREIEHGLRLYVQRVLIMENCEDLLPSYLAFVKGVVDSSDLPLNISREMLQENPLLEKIQRNIVRNVLDKLAEMKNTQYEQYVKFFEAMGDILKTGLAKDYANREKIADLLLFESLKTPAGKYTTLANYVGSMPESQKEIYYLTGEDRSLLESSPFLEAYRKQGYDVLLCTDPIDEFMLPQLYRYKDKPLKSVDRNDALPPEAKSESADSEQFAPLLAHLKKLLAADVSDVRLSQRLTDSAACLVADPGQASAYFERLMHRTGRGSQLGEVKRALEINPSHPTLRNLLQIYQANADDPRVELFGRILLDQALILEGSKVKDPAGFSQRLNALLSRLAN
jgi:molecular chaperone HtpG